MKPWAEKVEERFREHGDRLDRLEKSDTAQQTTRGMDSLGRAIDRGALRWERISLGTIASGDRVVGEGRMTLGTYATGGVTLSEIPAVPGRVDIRANPAHDAAAGANYIFKWNESTDKMALYRAGTGAEVPDTTDVSGVADWPFEVIGRSPARVVYRASGPEQLVRAEIEVASDVAKDAADYWTLHLRTRDEDTPDGVPFGDEHSTATYRLDGGSPAILHGASETDPAIVLAKDTRIVLYAEETGTADALEDLVLWLLLRRTIR